ncbi:outer membrane protein assembly factor BamB [Vibrio sinaloensis]|uniref:outer membrane protein assembly factor BamB n=1 Tax=Photobacterium sp. (strain ATCC 43367) TaxID=379097 RepID=UPI002068695A|nr:outer membrane protein assembly factor BamB [Vibrio sinaloensis]UPQ87399.1 outer membrane protein assembly factor BamB [Vibrio sinaloensis]
MKNLLKKALATAICVGVLAGCAGEEDTVIMAPVPQVSSAFTPTTQWTSSIGKGVGQFYSKLSAEYAYDKVFVASRDGMVKALDPENGRLIWQANVEEDVSARLSGGITAGYGQLFIGSENGRVFAFDQETGELNWQVDVNGEVLAAPATDSNLVIVHTNKGILLALDQVTGETRWTISTEVPNLTLRGNSAPVTASGGVFWGTANGRLAAAIVERGQLIWQQPIGKPQGATEIDRLVDVDASPLILGSSLYIVGYNGQLTAIDLRSGEASWKRNYSSASNLASDASSIYLVTEQDHLIAVDARSGTELWTNEQLENRLVTAPVIIDSYLVVGDSEGYLYWLERDSGDFVSMQQVSSSGFAVGPTPVEDGYVLVTRDGDVKKLTINK